MRTVFVDAAYYIAILNPRDQYAAFARRVAHERLERTVTTALIVTEVCNYLSAPRYRQSVCKLVETLNSTVQTDLIYPDVSLWNRTHELYAARTDKSWSLTDCMSFIVMQDQSLTEALTADRHFEQAGFTILMK
jgi:uncharacterized protein